MTKRRDGARHHIPNDVLISAIDDELSSSEAARVDLHLSECDECKGRYQQFRALSVRVETWASDVVTRSSPAARELLERRLDAQQPVLVVGPAGKVLRRFSWGMAIAATLALGVLFAPGRNHTSTSIPTGGSMPFTLNTFEVNGETFVALPYSNPDLPVSTSHVVQMQVPISSLTDAGVALEPISTQEVALDHSVLADVLVGMDGQPLGVHVLSME